MELGLSMEDLKTRIDVLLDPKATSNSPLLEGNKIGDALKALSFLDDEPGKLYKVEDNIVVVSKLMKGKKDTSREAEPEEELTRTQGDATQVVVCSSDDAHRARVGSGRVHGWIRRGNDS